MANFCVYCGNALDPNAPFCNVCGAATSVGSANSYNGGHGVGNANPSNGGYDVGNANPSNGGYDVGNANSYNGGYDVGNANPYDAGVPFDYQPFYYDGDAPVAPTFWGAFGHCVKNYCNFQGRATRTEFWGFHVVHSLLALVLAAVLAGLAGALDAPILALLLWAYILGLLLPMWALHFRRMHDLDYSGGWLFLSFLPFVGGICGLVLVIAMGFVRGTDVPNRFGARPVRR